MTDRTELDDDEIKTIIARKAAVLGAGLTNVGHYRTRSRIADEVRRMSELTAMLSADGEEANG